MTSLFDLPESSGGVLVSGGSIANQIAVVTARSRFGEDFGNGVIYASTRSHHSIEKAARIAGISTNVSGWSTPMAIAASLHRNGPRAHPTEPGRAGLARTTPPWSEPVSRRTRPDAGPGRTNGRPTWDSARSPVDRSAAAVRGGVPSRSW
ncbi:MAG: hypothetical protein HOK58_02130 [Acidimicrobiaceae bacterium]|nr:hypothetical protein [Acidimicrobiaceae bacterium]